uniref:Putative Sugar Porter n=1 Tax=Yarrowia alimentaria TaxID=479092 RepID=A0A1N6MBX0_9ASCO|nr:putative Sugar Porter [Yarrowia alimentaria]
MFWKNMKNEPKQVLNWTLWLSVLVFGMLGSARGLDEGNISGSSHQVSFENQFGLRDPNLSESQKSGILSNITAMVQLGSVGGSIIAMFLQDKIGRVRCLQQMLLIWIAGVIIQVTSHSQGQLLAGRFIAGLGIGQSVVIGPTYLTEVSPKNVRGLCTCVFSGSVYLGIMLEYFANYSTTLNVSNESRLQWVLPTSVQFIFAGLLFIGSFFIYESPRWLMKVGKEELAIETLSKIRHLPVDDVYVQGEILEVREQVEREKQALSGTSIFSLLKELFTTKANRYRLFIGIMVQLLGQWSGANAVTIYSPQFFAMLGVTARVDRMMYTAILGIVKFCASVICAVFLIDTIGRRRSLYIGVVLQFVSMLYLGIYLTIVPASSGAVEDRTKSQQQAGGGAIAAIYLSGCGWALGWNSIQYLINAEIYTVRHRSLACGIIMVFHFVNQYGNSKTLPYMRKSLTDHGTMFFFSGVILIGLAWSWFFLPEVSGRSLESIDEMFSLPWYLIGRRGHKLVPETSTTTQLQEDEDLAKTKKGATVHVENC